MGAGEYVSGAMGGVGSLPRFARLRFVGRGVAVSSSSSDVSSRDGRSCPFRLDLSRCVYPAEVESACKTDTLGVGFNVC